MFTTLFLDLNSYFASVEQQLRPETRGKPLAVAAVDAPTTCCIAASYEAKAFGVKTGVMISDAVKMCPGLRVVIARPEEYVKVHHRILEAVDTCLPVDAVHSIDEVSCLLLGRERVPQAAFELAHRIKRVILKQVGECLRCSIGLATNTFLAKIATDMQKPDGLIAIPREDLPRCLFKLKLIDLPGIGPRMEMRLNRQGIDTVEHLCALSQQQLKNAWGSVIGARWWHLLRGDEIPTELTPHKKSLGHQHVLPPEFRHAEAARAVLVRLIHKAAARMRHEKLSAAQMIVYAQCSDRTTWVRKIGLLDGQDTLEMTRVFGNAWSEQPPMRPLLVGITLVDLKPAATETMPLFAEDARRGALNRALDKLNLKYGPCTVYPASMQTAKESAPMRIAFKSIPDLTLAGK
ncbi:MAG: helix-hairpin-helix domain-containing protein [Planctomycetota bacterium]